jgi:two-component sensor histidine kinase
MAKAAGRPAPAVQEKAAWDDAELREFAARLEDLARAQDEARSAVGDDEASYAVAFEQLFVAVARLNPLHGAALIRPLAQSSVMSSETAPTEARPSLRRT